MNKQLRILRIYYYGKIKLAKAISRRIQFGLIDWFDEMSKKMTEVKKPTYTWWDSRTGETFESETAPPPTTITLKKENYNP